MEPEGPRWWPGLTLHHRLMLKARKSDAPRKAVARQGSHGDLVAKPWGSPTVGRGLGSMPALRSAHAHRCLRQPVPVPGMRTMGRGGYVLCALKTLSVPACRSPREELLWRQLCGCPASGKFFLAGIGVSAVSSKTSPAPASPRGGRGAGGWRKRSVVTRNRVRGGRRPPGWHGLCEVN